MRCQGIPRHPACLRCMDPAVAFCPMTGTPDAVRTRATRRLDSRRNLRGRALVPARAGEPDSQRWPPGVRRAGEPAFHLCGLFAAVHAFPANARRLGEGHETLLLQRLPHEVARVAAVAIDTTQWPGRLRRARSRWARVAIAFICSHTASQG